MSSQDLQSSPTVFICYAHGDEGDDEHERWSKQLLTHLRPLFGGEVQPWIDQDIVPGKRWADVIRERLRNTKVAVLLVGPAFLNSDFIREEELPVLLTMEGDSDLTIIPVHVRYSAFRIANFKYPDPFEGPEEISLAAFQSANSPDLPLEAITDMSTRRRALVEIAEKIQATVVGPLPNPPPPEPPSPQPLLPQPPAPPSPSPSPPLSGRYKTALLLLAALFVVVAASFLYLRATDGPPPPPAPTPVTFRIVKPAEDELVGWDCKLVAESPYTELTHYVLVTPPNYGQGGIAWDRPLQPENGKWAVSGKIGQSGDYGKEFTVRLFAVGRKLEDSELSNLSDPPPSAKVSDPVTVRRAPAKAPAAPKETASPHPQTGAR